MTTKPALQKTLERIFLMEEKDYLDPRGYRRKKTKDTIALVIEKRTKESPNTTKSAE